MLSTIRQFTLTIWLIVLATFAGRFVFFMIWPFLAILLHRQYGLTELEIGAFLALAAVIGVSFGFFIGFLSDKIGRRKIIIAGLIVSVVSMVVMGTAGNLWALFIGTLLQSIARPMVEDPGRALMTDTVEDRQVKDMALQVRYFALNVGAALGPMLGAAAGLSGQQSTFLILAAVYGLYLAAALAVFSIERPLSGSAMARNLSMGEVLTVLRKDKAFLYFLLATFLVDVGYGQMESGLVQYLEQNSVPDLTVLYSLLIALNAATIVIFQFPLMHLTRRLEPFTRIFIGVALFGIGFLGFALSPLTPPLGLYLSMFILSLGETLVFPTMSIIIDRLAKPEMKGSYFGAYSLSIFGFSAAPLVGGAMLYWFGGATLWYAMVGLAIFTSLLLQRSNRLSVSEPSS